MDDDAIIMSAEGQPFRFSMRFVPCAEHFLSNRSTDFFALSRCCERSCNAGSTKCGCVDVSAFENQAFAKSNSKWVKPHVLVFAHGLWSLDQSDMTCDQYHYRRSCYQGGVGTTPMPRHQTMATEIAQISERVDTVLWATNPNIDYHAAIAREHVAQDRVCQLTAAAQRNLSILDVWQRSTCANGPHNIRPIDYHLDEMGHKTLWIDIFCKIGCGGPECSSVDWD